jgi:hypothetical protein
MILMKNGGGGEEKEDCRVQDKEYVSLSLCMTRMERIKD